jgi:hypothetical protein
MTGLAIRYPTALPPLAANAIQHFGYMTQQSPEITDVTSQTILATFQNTSMKVSH